VTASQGVAPLSPSHFLNNEAVAHEKKPQKITVTEQPSTTATTDYSMLLAACCTSGGKDEVERAPVGTR
jgi:hypothetical protein